MGLRGWFGRLAALVLAALAGAIGMADSAVAHARPVLRVTAEEPVEPLVLRFRVRFEYNDDVHPLAAATVVVTGSSAAGDVLASTPVGRVEGQPSSYETVVSFPSAGEWSLQFSATGPSATLAHQSVVAPPPPTTTTAPPTTTPERHAQAETNDKSDDDGLPLAPIALVAAAALAAARQLDRSGSRPQARVLPPTT